MSRVVKTEFYERLGKAVAEARMAQSLTQDEVAAQLYPPVKRGFVAHVENGRSRCLAHTIVQLADVLRVDLRRLAMGAP